MVKFIKIKKFSYLATNFICFTLFISGCSDKGDISKYNRILFYGEYTDILFNDDTNNLQIDQSQSNISKWYSFTGNNLFCGQSFVPEKSPIADISIYVKAYYESGPIKIKITLYSDFGGNPPTGTLIASKSLQIQFGKWYSIGLDKPITVVPGRTYYLVIEGENWFTVYGSGDDVYPYGFFFSSWDNNGKLLDFTNIKDIAFKTLTK